MSVGEAYSVDDMDVFDRPIFIRLLLLLVATGWILTILIWWLKKLGIIRTRESKAWGGRDKKDCRVIITTTARSDRKKKKKTVEQGSEGIPLGIRTSNSRCSDFPNLL